MNFFPSMSSKGRAVLIAAATVAMSAATSAAWADPSVPDDYVPNPATTVSITSPVCSEGVAVVAYTIDDPAIDSVDITWESTAGPSAPLPDQPLTGEVIWPGTELDESGEPVSFPGWEKIDDNWVADQDDAWAASPVKLTFSTSPPEVVSVKYPGSPQCGPQGRAPGPGPVPTAAPSATAVPGQDSDADATRNDQPASRAQGPTADADAAKGSSTGTRLPITGGDIALYSGIAAVVIGLGVAGVRLSKRSRKSV